MRVSMQRPEKYTIVKTVITQVYKEIAKANTEDKNTAFANMNKLHVSAILCYTICGLLLVRVVKEPTSHFVFSPLFSTGSS